MTERSLILVYAAKTQFRTCLDHFEITRFPQLETSLNTNFRTLNVTETRLIHFRSLNATETRQITRNATFCVSADGNVT